MRKSKIFFDSNDEFLIEDELPENLPSKFDKPLEDMDVSEDND